MQRGESVYLDVVRFTAACLVVLTHFIQFGMLPQAWKALAPDLGREAVIVFFVLSGYVIAFAADTKYQDAASYFIARASRLYSVALPVLLLALGLDCIGIYLLNGSYTHLYQYEKFYFYLPFHLLFLGEVWTLAERPFTADPYWSLSFEAWYYVWFASLFYFSGWRRALFFLAVAVIVGYQHWILFPIWLSGVCLYLVRDKYHLTVCVARIGMALTASAVILFEYSGFDDWLWRLGRETWPFPNLPQGSTDQYLLDYVICLCATCHLFCARQAKLNFSPRVSAIIKNLASYTFTLYLIHTVVMASWKNNFVYDNNNYRHLALLVMLIATATLLLGQLTEKKRQSFQRAIIFVLKRIGFWRSAISA